MSADIGDPAPELALVDDRGEPWRLRDLAGHPVVITLHRHFY